MPLAKVRILYGRAKYILRDEGAFYFIRLVFSRLLKSLLSYEYLYYYEKELKEQDKVEFVPKIPNVTLEIIRTAEQYNELAIRGYHFESMVSKELINKGGIALCTFVQRELACINWIATNEESKKYIDPIPFNVDFQNGEACSGGSRTFEQYRGQGLYGYSVSALFRFLREEGKTVDKFTASVNNVAVTNTIAKFNPKIMKLEYRTFFFHSHIKITPTIYTAP